MEKQKKGLKKRLIHKLCVSNKLLPKYTNNILKKNVSNSNKKNLIFKRLPNRIITIRMKNNNVFYTLRNFKKTLKTTSSKRFPIQNRKFMVGRNMQKIVRLFFKNIKRLLSRKIEIKAHVSLYTKKRLFKNIKKYFSKFKCKKKSISLLTFSFEQKKCFNGCRSKKKKRKKRKKARFKNS